MEVLVRQYKKAENRKVIDWFCTGMDLLWKVPRSTNPSNLRWVTVMFWDSTTERYKILFRDGTDAWVTGEAIDEAIAFNAMHSDLDKANAAKEKWSPAVTATLRQYGMYSAKNVGPQSFQNNQGGTAMLNGVELQPQRFPEATTDASKEAMNRDSTETGEVAVITDQTIDPKVAEAMEITSEPRAYVSPEYRRPEYILNDIYIDMIDRRDVYLTNNGVTGQPDSEDGILLEYWIRAKKFDPTDAEEHDALVRFFSEGEECSNPAWLVQDGGFPGGDPLENPLLTTKAEKQALLQAKLALAKRETLGTQTLSKGTVMCFMLPKNNATPRKLVNVYGKLAHDLTTQTRTGLCILQNGEWYKATFLMMMEGMDRMKEEKFRSRCPTGRLQSWYDKKCLDETQVEKASLEHQNEEHLCGVLSIAEGQHVCIQIAKHEVVFGILAHNVTETMLHGTCIISDTAVGSVKYKTYAYLTLLSGVARLRLNVHKVRTPTAELETKLALEKLDPLAMAMKIANASQMYTTGPGNKDKKGLSVDATHNTLPRTDIADHHAEQPRSEIALSKDTRVCLILSPFKIVFGVVVLMNLRKVSGTKRSRKSSARSSS
jgi:hypothetical protein